MRLRFSLLLGKFLSLILHTLHYGGGSAAPGLYALKFDPQLLKKLSNQVPHTMVIAGTNGKTTTAKMLSHFATQAGLKVLRNATGSNLERGVASALIQHISLKDLFFSKKLLPYDVAIWETDEAAFNTIVPKVKPDVFIFLNIFRDQLDRYGEVDSIIKKWQKTMKGASKQTTMIINKDDQNLLELTKDFPGTIHSFSLGRDAIKGEKSFSKVRLDDEGTFEVEKIISEDLSGSLFSLYSHGQYFKIHMPVPGIYHIYDLLAALAGGCQLNVSIESMVKSLKDYQPAFGRVERIDLSNVDTKAQEAILFLIKNPFGADEVFKTISKVIQPSDTLLLALNDNYADGTDVSWIWDAHFELLNKVIPSAAEESRSLHVGRDDSKVFVSGGRAYDLALRLKYAEFETSTLVIEPHLSKAFDQALKQSQGRIFILPTYTALLELQKLLSHKGLKKDYWKEAHV